MHFFPFQGPFDGDEDVFFAEGFGDKVVGSFLDGLFRGFDGAVGGNNYNRDYAAALAATVENRFLNLPSGKNTRRSSPDCGPIVFFSER